MTAAPAIDLDALLRRLHLPTVRRLYPDLATRAESEDMAYRDYLAVLMAEEVAHRAQTRIQRCVRRARFPFLKTIDEYDFTFQSAVRLSLLGSALGPEFVTGGHSLVLSGPSGTGKTHLAVAVAYRAIQNGFDAAFTTATALIAELSLASRRGRLRHTLTAYTHPHVLVIDEVGYLSYGPDAANVLFQVVNDRYLHQRPLIFTTNKPLAAWGRVLHDPDLAEAILDRVLERGRHIELRGRSYRTRHAPLDLNPGPEAPSPEPARVSGNHPPEFPERARLLAVGRAGTAEHVERIVRGWRCMDRKAEERDAARRHASRSLHVYPDEDGSVRIRGRLSPEMGALLVKALAAAREALYRRRHAQPPESDPPTMEQQQADALELLAEAALRHELDPGAPGERYQVVVHVDAEVLEDLDATGQSVFEDGARVPAGTSQRLACDASRVVMRHDADGRVVEVGARTRTIPPALRRALHHRDGGCRFPECGVRFGQGHHIHHWAQGGPTTLANLVLLCRRHHRAVHEEGFEVDRSPDGELRFRRPDGRPIHDVPPPSPVPEDPVKDFRSQREEQGLRVDVRSPKPGWFGERLDVGYAIDVLHPLACGH